MPPRDHHTPIWSPHPYKVRTPLMLSPCPPQLQAATKCCFPRFPRLGTVPQPHPEQCQPPMSPSSHIRVSSGWGQTRSGLLLLGGLGGFCCRRMYSTGDTEGGTGFGARGGGDTPSIPPCRPGPPIYTPAPYSPHSPPAPAARCSPGSGAPAPRGPLWRRDTWGGTRWHWGAGRGQQRAGRWHLRIGGRP